MAEWTMRLVSLSLSGTVMALVILVVRRLCGKRLSHAWHYYIWLVVIVRMLLPFAPEISLLGSFSARADQVIESAAPTAAGDSEGEPPLGAGNLEAYRGQWERAGAGESPADDARVNMMAPPLRLSAPPADAPARSPLWSAVFWVWAGGAAVLLLRKLLSYRHYIRLVRAGNRPVTDQEVRENYRGACGQMGLRREPPLCSNSSIVSPMLVGAVHPVIVLPPLQARGEALRYIFLHELAHYRRQDAWYKWLVQATACLHWFNPLVWWLCREVNRACELACDEAVLARLDDGARLGYGEVLLSSIGKCRAPVPAGAALLLGEDARCLKERLAAILRFHPPTERTVAAAVLLGVVLTAGAVFAGVYSVPGARAYRDDTVIAHGQDYGSMTQYRSTGLHDNRIELSFEKLEGVESLLLLNVLRESTLELAHEFAVNGGRLKLVLVDGSGDVRVLAEGDGTGTQELALPPGDYRLKLVGKNASAACTLAFEMPTEGGTQGVQVEAVSPQEKGGAYLERYSSNPAASVAVRAKDGTWAASTTVEGGTYREQMDQKLAYIEETFRERGASFLVEEGISHGEIANVDGIQYLHGRSPIYRELTAASGTLLIDTGGSFSRSASGETGILYDRHVFYLEQPSLLELDATYRLEQGYGGFLLVSPEGEIVYEQTAVVEYAHPLALYLEKGLWSFVLVSELEDGRIGGERRITGSLTQGTADGLAERASQIRALPGEYLAQGLDNRSWLYGGKPVALIHDEARGSWLAFSHKNAEEHALTLRIVRDVSVPGVIGLGRIVGIETYTASQWETYRQQQGNQT